MSNPFSLPNSHQNHLLSSSYGFLRLLRLVTPSSSTFLPQNSSKTLWDTWSDSSQWPHYCQCSLLVSDLCEKSTWEKQLKGRRISLVHCLGDFGPSWIGALFSRHHIEAPHIMDRSGSIHAYELMGTDHIPTLMLSGKFFSLWGFSEPPEN